MTGFRQVSAIMISLFSDFIFSYSYKTSILSSYWSVVAPVVSIHSLLDIIFIFRSTHVFVFVDSSPQESEPYGQLLDDYTIVYSSRFVSRLHKYP